jgi:hypothetical protein
MVTKKSKGKVQFFIEDQNGKPLDEFYSKTVTALFDDLPKGTVVRFSCDEGEDYGKQYIGDYVVKGLAEGGGGEPIPKPPIHNECPGGYHWDETEQKCVIDMPPVPPNCPDKQHWDETQMKCVPDQPEPEPEPEPTDEVLYDSTKDSQLHDKKVRTVTKEGAITAGGLGIECRASGSPKIQVNDDGTFSLICSAGHGRFYLYCLNYDATLELEAAWWKGNGDCSTKLESRHNEGAEGPNRFGGYGLAIDRSSWNSKREIFHNEHDQSTSGTLPQSLKNGEYWKLEFTVKHDDANTKAVMVGKLNGKTFMTKTDSKPLPYMLDKALYKKQSYLWVRSNVDTETGELRIRKLRVLKA